MSERSYLVSSDLDTLHPSFVQDDFEPEKQTICTDLESVPLTWLALFREGNIRRTKFEIEGEKIEVEAPIVERTKGLEQLEAALPYFNKMFQQEGQLDSHFAQLKQALSTLPYRFVTIELVEIAMMYDDEQWYYDEFRAALHAIGGKIKPDDRERILGITNLRDGVSWPKATMYLDRVEFGPEDQWNLSRLLGVGQYGSFGWGRIVPWETPDADYGFAFTPIDDDDAFEFEDDEEEEA